MELAPTTAHVTQHFDTGEPAVTRNTCGMGEAIVVGWEASQAAWKPGNQLAEEQIRTLCVGDGVLPFQCAEAIVYRLAAPTTDHYFIINDGPQRRVSLQTPGYDYVTAGDPVTGDTFTVGAAFEVAAHSARWIRFAKR